MAAQELGSTFPIGISFMTFTMISYVVDVFKKNFPPVTSFSHLFAYLLFFPRILAGPILRPSELIPQLLRSKSGKFSSLGLGLTILTLGLIKKVIFADSMNDAVNPIFDNPIGHNTPTYWLAILGYTLQVYCDFSGYTDMAIGTSVIFGIRLPINFNKPYTSINLRDFWHRWHITLSRWLRDYIYIPLGGNQCSKPRYLSNIIFTMVICGIWHGANWTFVLWGLLHGIGLMGISSIKYSQTLTRFISIIPKKIKWLLTFLFLVLSWILFRSPNIETATTILIGAFTINFIDMDHFFSSNLFFLILLTVFALSHRYDSLVNVRLFYRRSKKVVLAMIILMSWIIIIGLSTPRSNSFIYLDF